MSRADRRTACLTALAAAILALPFLSGISMLDEGTLVHIADRLASGEVLYRDVATGVMPGAFYFHALLFVLFGRSLLVGRIFMIVLFALASAGVFVTARGVTSRAVALATALSFSALSANYWRFPGYSPEAICLIFLTLAAARAYLRTRARKWLLFTGLGLGVTLLVKQNYGAFAALGVAIGFVASPVDLRSRLRDVATTAAVAVLPIAATVALFALAGAASHFLHYTVEIPLRVPSTIFARPYPSLWGDPDARMLRDLVYYLPFEELALELLGWLRNHAWISMTVIRATYYLPLLFFLVASFVWVRRWSRERMVESPRPNGGVELAVGALYLATSLFVFLGTFPRVDAHHLFMALAPSFVLAAWLIGTKPPSSLRRGAVFVSGVLLTLSVASQIAAVADVYPEEVRDAYVAHPRVGVWVQRWQAAELERHLREIEARVPEGEPIFVGPAAPMYYFLSDRPNALRFPLILPGALDENEVVRALDSEPIRYALISDLAFENFPFHYVAPLVWSYVEKNFVPAEGAGWDVAPRPPYLYTRGRKEDASEIDFLTVDSERGLAADARPPLVTVRGELGDWVEVGSLMRPPLSPSPIFQTVASDEWRDRDAERAFWQSSYLEPSLVVRAPGGWRKVLVSWEVPAAGGYVLELACALPSWAWASWMEGQGAVVEIWVTPVSEAGAPRRVWRRWLDPRHVPADRRWHRVAVDLASVAQTPRAYVSFVVGSAPTFAGRGAAWSGLRLFVSEAASSATVSSATETRNVRLPEAIAHQMLAYDESDVALFEEAAARFPDLPRAHSALAEVAESLGRHDLALPAIRKAARLDPEVPHYWMRLGQELQIAGRHSDAVEAMRVALELEPENPNYYAAMGAALLPDPGRVREAREALRRATELDPGNVWAWTLRATLERRAGDAAEAVRAAERSVALEPDRAWTRLALAESLRELGRTAEAVRTLEEAARLEMDAGARSALARSLLALGRAESAREQALGALEQDGSAAASWVVLAQVDSAMERWESAVGAWREAVARDPKNSSALVQLARALARLGRNDEALETLLEAKQAAKDEPSRLRELAIVYDEVRRPREALAAWRRVHALAPEGEVKEEARRRLGVEPRRVHP